MGERLTITDIQRQLSPRFRLYQITYAIAAHDVMPRERIGHSRVWAVEDMPAIVAALEATTGTHAEILPTNKTGVARG